MNPDSSPLVEATNASDRAPGGHPFDHPVNPENLARLRSLFADAAARYSPIGYALVVMATPWPVPPEIQRALGRDDRPSHQYTGPDRTGPPAEIFFGRTGAVERYFDLAKQAARLLPLPPEYPDRQLTPWNGTLLRLATDQASFPYSAPQRLYRAYPDGRVLAIQGEQDQALGRILVAEQTQGFGRHTAEAFCLTLSDLWTASLEALNIWPGQGAALDPAARTVAGPLGELTGAPLPARDATAFVPAKELLKKPFDTYPRLRAALEKNRWIRTRKPSPQRLEVHAGDWHRFLAQRQSAPPDPLDLPAEVVDAAVRVVQERKDREYRHKAGQ
jgi:hypothetical protein